MTVRVSWMVLPLAVCAGACSSDTGGMMGGVTGLGGVGGPVGVAGMAAPGTTAGTPAVGTGGMGGSVVGPVAGQAAMAGMGGTTPVPQAGAGGAGGSGAPGNCEGFPLEGLKYSPGGDVLPRPCEPFHPTTNNPYAVRCVDAWPWFETQYPGDEFCILPPPPDKGIQYGVHPQGVDWYEQVSNGDMSGYENPSDDFVMTDGQEEERNYFTVAPNMAESNFYRSYARMRGGSHHMIVSTNSGGNVGTWGPGSPDGLFGGTSLPGAQRPDENTPKSLLKPTEDDGLYQVIPANPGVTFNMHHFNSTGKPILKEAWTNLWWEEKAVTRVYGILGLELLQTATLSVAPGTTTDLHYSWNINEPIRLVTVFGHRHAWTTNFTSWVEKPSGDTEIVYQSFDWFDEPTYRYDSMTMNPAPAPENRTDGASSGVRMLNAGEKLHFNCHIEYTDERAQAEGAPSPSSIGTLRFANQAFTAEMCILFGSTAAVRLPTPTSDASPLPGFATID
jgi:hypothetical protein